MLDVSKIIITPEILLILCEIDEFKGAWQLLGRMAPEKLNTLSDAALAETLDLLTQAQDSPHLNSNDGAPLANLESMYKEIFKNYETIDFSESTITHFYRQISNDVCENEQNSDVPVVSPDVTDTSSDHWKGLNITFYKTTLFEAANTFKLTDIVEWTQKQIEDKIYHPLVLSSVFMAFFLISNPFQNYSVRLSRMFVTLLLLKMGYFYVPYSSFERIIERNHEYYRLALKRTQESVLADAPDFETWILFFLKIMQTQKRNLEKKLGVGKNLNQHISALDGQILGLVSEFEKISISDIQKKTGVNRNTLKKHLARLTDENYIVRFGKARATWYTLPY